MKHEKIPNGTTEQHPLGERIKGELPTSQHPLGKILTTEIPTEEIPNGNSQRKRTKGCTSMTIEFPENIYRAIGLRAYKLDTTKKEVVITAFKLTTLQESYTNQTIKEISSGLEKIIEDCKLRFTEEDLDRIILLEDECDGVTVVPIEVKLEEEEIILEELTPADLEEMERQRIAKWPS